MSRNLNCFIARIFLAGIFFIPQPGSAQIVNVENARMHSDTVGWMGGLGGAVSLSQSTQKIFQASFESHVQYKTSNDQGLWMLLGNLSYLSTGGNRHVSDKMGHIRYNRKINGWMRWEVFGQLQNNFITQIASRLLFGTGPRFKLVKRKTFKLYTASLFMYEREKENTVPVILHRDLRNSSYLSFTWEINQNVELLSTTYFQPLVKKFSDNRVLNSIVFRVKASPHFALSVKWNYLHDRFPAGDAPRTTYSFATGVNYDL